MRRNLNHRENLIVCGCRDNDLVTVFKLCERGARGSRGCSCAATDVAGAAAACAVTGVSAVGRSYKSRGSGLTEELPSKLGVVDKYVSVTLNTLNNVVSAHFPGVNGVDRAPVKKHFNALEYVCNAVAL